ncbi:MAG: ROK family protein [Chloroflexota bacterium]
MTRPTSTEAVKHQNRSAILKLIREQGAISRVEIARALGLNPSTVSRLVDELMAQELVIEGNERGHSTHRGGRRSIALKCNPEAGYLIGVDLGGTNIVGGLATLDGEIVARCCGSSRSATGEVGDGSLQRLIDLAQDLIRQCPDPSRLWGVGVGAPAVTLSEEGIVTWAPALGWRDLPLKQIMEHALGLPVFVENDVNLAALGEHWCGAAQGVDDLVAIFIGTGIGSGVILGGKLYRGAGHAAGEVGYMVVDVDSLERRYDQFGCLETLASGSGIAVRARTRIETDRKTILASLLGDDATALTAEAVFDAAREGDPVAGEVVDETVRYLALAVANVACVLNPEVIVIGGGVARSADMLLDGIRQKVDGVVPQVPRLVASALGKDAVVKGAFALVLRQVSEVDWRIPERP